MLLDNQPEAAMSFSRYVQITIAFAIGAGLVGCATPVTGTASKECWRHQLGEQNFRNLITVCATEEQASLVIYFPNPSDVPTTCTQPGVVKEKGKGTTRFQFEAGSCLNGRTGMELTLICQDAPSKSLNCHVEPPTSLKGEYLFEHVK